MNGLPASMRSLRYVGAGESLLEELPLPVRRDGETLVRIEASALCGSEREDIVKGHPSNFGHEAAGVVVEADPDSAFEVGERSASTPCSAAGCAEPAAPVARRCVNGLLTCSRGGMPTTRWFRSGRCDACLKNTTRALRH